ncbi:hypothetical protein [Staphylococcus aureus]|uniref:hypothetical protein n=1 Tax=Staphylococcus aureus TaxID=1280 RepID=UPI001BFD174E|nr:hypothetical protein [Staphylococcus aureus]
MNKEIFNYQKMWNDIRRNMINSSQIQQEIWNTTNFMKSSGYQNLRNYSFFIGDASEISEKINKSLNANIARIGQVNKETIEAFRHSFGHSETVLDNIIKLNNFKIPSVDIITHIINKNDIVKITNLKILSDTNDSEVFIEEKRDYTENNSLKEIVEYLTNKLFEPLWDYIVVANRHTIGYTTNHTYELALKNSEWFYFYFILNIIQLSIFIACYESEDKHEEKIK